MALVHTLRNRIHFHIRQSSIFHKRLLWLLFPLGAKFFWQGSLQLKYCFIFCARRFQFFPLYKVILKIVSFKLSSNYRALTCFRQFLLPFRPLFMHSICLFVFPLKWKERKISCCLAGHGQKGVRGCL